jgi:hypothetical protein
MKGLLQDDREQYIIGGLAKAASSALKKFFNKSSREDFSIKNLIEDYDKLSPKQAQKKFDKNIADLKGKDFDMFMVNEVNLSAEERAFVKEQYPDFTGNTAADVYRHTKSEKVVDDMYSNNQQQALKEQAEEYAKYYDDIPANKPSPDDDIPFYKGGRVTKAEGGSLLQDDREQYIIGGLAKLISKSLIKKNSKGKIINIPEAKKELKKLKNDLKDIKKSTPDDSRLDDIEILEETINDLQADIIKTTENVADDYMARGMFAEGGSLLQDDMAMVEEDMPTEETHMMPDGTEMPGATHGEGENMAPDEEMEKEFLDFILDEALSPEEEDMLMSRLEQDEELAMLFDKVIDVAQEFAGSGPVEGPGSGVSDSIPARLSDGEFVFTAKAVEALGADNLMAMMKEAEAAVDERQGLAEGGLPDEETVTMEVQEQKEPKVQIAKAAVNSTRGLLDEDEISKGIKSKMMLDPLQKHVRS